MITERKRNGSTWTVVAGFVAAAGLVVAACETPAPTVADDGDGDEAVGVFQAVEWEADAPRVIEEQAAREGSTIRLRGVTSIGRQGTGALAEPLVYIDGVRVSDATVEDGAPGRTPLSSVRPEDIDRIEVVKGEAARAIYGEEAAAGIIQIFTKPGEETGTARLRERREPSDREAAGLSGKILDATERGLHGALRLIGRPAESPGPVAGSIDAIQDEPLVVVDGEVISRAKLETVDRNRIDRIEIVKGGAAARLYGERGANGVIQVYLKKR